MAEASNYVTPMPATPGPTISSESTPRPKYTLDDPRLKPSSSSPAAQATFLRRLGRIRASQPTTRPGRISRAAGITNYVLIPRQCLVLIVFLGYGIFFVDWGPHEHVFSKPQRWLTRKKEEFWSLPSDKKNVSESQEK